MNTLYRPAYSRTVFGLHRNVEVAKQFLSDSRRNELPSLVPPPPLPPSPPPPILSMQFVKPTVLRIAMIPGDGIGGIVLAVSSPSLLPTPSSFLRSSILTRHVYSQLRRSSPRSSDPRQSSSPTSTLGLITS